MKILKSVYEQIRNTLGSKRPEEGGMLLTNDGGETITQYIYDPKGSRSGSTYSPDVDFLNDQIKKNRNKGSYYVGMIHSHPYGCTGLSVGKGVQKYGHTSDEDAIHKLMSGMKGTNKLYFPIVQSSFGGGQFSIRMFFALRGHDSKLYIGEEPVDVVEENSSLWAKNDVAEKLGCETKENCAVVIVGLDDSCGCVEKLARNGIATFVLVDDIRFAETDMQCEAAYWEIGTYKADAIARKIRKINPFATIRIIRNVLNDEVTDAVFEQWIEGLNRSKTLLCLCSTERSVCKRTKKISKRYKIKVVEAVKRNNTIETFMFEPSKKRSYRLRFYCINETFDQEIAEDAINGARKDATLSALENTIVNSNSSVNSYIGGVTAKSINNKWDSLYSMQVIEQKTVVVVGCGGSRSYIENLARAGIKRFVLIDGDTYSMTNTQTQMAYFSELGKNKAEVIGDQIKLINPNAEVVVKKHMLDEKISDKQFSQWVGEVINQRPQDVLIAGCTDNFFAQARCSRLALKFGCPYIQAGIYTGGKVLEIIFFHPAVSKVCPRCMLKGRYDVHLNSPVPPKPAESKGTSIFFTEELNAKKGFISLALLLYHTDSDARYSNFLDDNKWVSHNGKHIEDRNFMFYTMDYHLADSTGIKAYSKFDRWGRMLGNRYQVGVCYFLKKKPMKGCPDCGGKGNLSKLKGAIPDTRVGLYK